MVVNGSLYTYGYRGKKRDKVIKKLVKGEKIKKLFVVVLPFLSDGLLEIYPYEQLMQPFYKELSDSINVVGIANSKKNATSLIVDMVQDIYDSDCDFDVHRFFEM